MRLTCGRLEQCGVRSECLSTNFGSIKIRPVCFCPQFSLPSNNMSAPAKSTTPIAPAVVESKDWTKATTLELQSGSEDESSVLDAKAKERRRRKQVRREERQRREAEERRAREEAERNRQRHGYTRGYHRADPHPYPPWVSTHGCGYGYMGGLVGISPRVYPWRGILLSLKARYN